MGQKVLRGALCTQDFMQTKTVSLARALSLNESDVSLDILLAPWTGSMMQNKQRFVTELSICMRKKIAPSLGAI